MEDEADRLPVGTCPRCGGKTDLCSLGPTFEDGPYFVCRNYDRCGYSGSPYANLDAARNSDEAKAV